MTLSSKPVLLIVDDTIENLQLLGAIFESEDIEIRVAVDGAKALDIIEKYHVDIVLLDVMLPDLSGYEVCSRIKINPQFSNIPVIFLTALGDEVNEAEGLARGGADYISKPFKPDLIKKRVRNQLELRMSQLNQKYYAAMLEQEVTQRTHELKLANEKLKKLDKAKSSFLTIISNEFKVPTFGILGIGQLALFEIEDLEKRARFQQLYDTNKKRIDEIVSNSMRLGRFLEQKDRLALKPLRITDLIDEIQLRFQNRGQGDILDFIQDDLSGVIEADFDLLTRSIESFIGLQSAIAGSEEKIKVGHSSHGKRLNLTLVSRANFDIGRVHEVQSLFDIISLPPAVKNLSLDLTLAQTILEALDVSFSFEARTTGQSILSFWFTEAL